MLIKTYNSPIAKLHIAIRNNAIIAISNSALDEEYLKKLEDHKAWDVPGNSPEELESQLDAYFEGKNPVFSLHLRLHGTEFQRKVWKACASIPYGQTRSYGEIAKMIGNPKATRAVGSALGNNPVPIIIPCHRVLQGGGKLGGFGWGLDAKQKLLDSEKM